MSEAPPAAAPAARAPGLPEIDVSERGGKRDGVPQVLDKRLFIQLQVFSVDRSSSVADASRSLVELLVTSGVGAVVYADVNDPRGLGLVSWSEDPAHFVQKVRPMLDHERARPLEHRPSMTMLGRTYSRTRSCTARGA